MVDSLKIYEILKSGSLPEEQAHAMTRAIQTADSAIVLDMKTLFDQQLIVFRQTFVTKDELKASLAELEARLTYRMFVFWIGQSAVTVGLLFTALKLFR